MAITTDQSNKMILEAAAGNEDTSFESQEAKEYYRELKRQVDEAIAKGYMVLPHNDD